MVEDNFSITFMFSTIYLRLEGKVPPSQEWKVGIMVRVTFYFLGHSDIGGWQGTPPPRNWNWTKHECNRKKSFQLRSASAFYNLPPPTFQYLIFCLKGKLVNFNFKWIFENLISGFRSQWLELDDVPHSKWNAHFWIKFNFWWLAKWSKWWKSTKI